MLRARRRPELAPSPGTLAPAAAQPAAQLEGSSRWLVLAAIAAVSFLLLLEDTAVSVAMPDIRRALGMGLGSMEWVVNSYTLALAVLVLPAGKLADRHGRRRVFLVGLLGFTLASLLAGLAGSGAVLIGARTLQGAGAALASSAALSIISVSFAEGHRGAALGVWGGASAVGLAVGPVAGAMLTEMFGWAWVFLVNVPLGALALLAVRLLIPESSAADLAGRLPWRSVVLWGAMLLAVVLALTEASRLGWLAPEVLVLGATGAALLGAFALAERRVGERLIDAYLLHSRQTVGANVLSLLSTAVMCNLFFFIALYLQLVLDYSVVAAGTALLPMTAMIVLVAPLAGRLSDRRGPRPPIIAGFLLLATGLAVLSTLGDRTAGAQIVVGLGLAGLGIGLATTPITAAALAETPEGKAGEGAGLLNTTRTIGLALGVATMGAIIARGGDVLGGGAAASEAFAFGLATALRVNAAVSLLAIVVAITTVKGGRARSGRAGGGLEVGRGARTEHQAVP